MDTWTAAFHVDLVDRDDDEFACSCVFASESVREPVIRNLRGAEVGESTEVYLKVHNYGGDSRDEDVGLAAEPAASEGLPTWAAVVMTLLVVLVLGLGVLVAILFKRTSTSSTGPPAG